MPPARATSVLGAVLVIVLKALLVALVVALPILGVWVSSSLAAYSNGPVWAAVLAGLLLFPVLPVGWELFARWRKARRRRRQDKGRLGEAPRDILTIGDRVLLRTVALNALFLGGLLATRPALAFTALSARGDWMLDGRHGPTAEVVRKKIFAAAGALEWLYAAAHDNPFRKYATDTPEPGPDTTASAAPTAAPAPSAAPSGTGERPPQKPDEPPSRDRPADRDAGRWPLAGELHPAVASMPSDAETSIASVARYLVDREHDPFLVVKALHDYVADRVAYDGAAYVAKSYPPQDAETVFRTKKAVCAGYSALLTALGRAAGREIVFVVGDARAQGSELSGEGHAWNAAKIEGRWYLIDATWDSGSLDGATFKKQYRSEYLLAPSEVFGLDHFPDDARWQLRDRPLSRGEFVRQPVLSPRFFADGYELVSPDRSQVDVHGSIDVSIKNPKGMHLLASFSPRTGGQGTHCATDHGPLSHVRCTFPTPGSWRVALFSNKQAQGTFAYVGQLEVNSD